MFILCTVICVIFFRAIYVYFLSSRLLKNFHLNRIMLINSLSIRIYFIHFHHPSYTTWRDGGDVHLMYGTYVPTYRAAKYPRKAHTHTHITERSDLHPDLHLARAHHTNQIRIYIRTCRHRQWTGWSGSGGYGERSFRNFSVKGREYFRKNPGNRKEISFLN